MSLIIKLRCMTQNLRWKSNQQLKCHVNKKLLEVLTTRSGKYFSNTVEEKNDVEVIHRGSLSGIIKKVKMFSLSTSVMTLLVQPFIVPKALESGGIGAAAGIVVSFGMFAFLTPLMLHLISSRYVTDISYDKKKNLYIASTWTIFLRKKKIEFTPTDVEKPGLAQLLTTVFVKGQPMFFIIEDFSDLGHYELIMGYDKPMDFGFDNPSQITTPVEEKIKVKKAN